MTAFNPLEATKRLEAAGIARGHAEAIAAEIYLGFASRASNEQLAKDLDAAFDRLAIRLGVILATVIAAAFAVLGVVLSI